MWRWPMAAVLRRCCSLMARDGPDGRMRPGCVAYLNAGSRQETIFAGGAANAESRSIPESTSARE